MKLKNGTSVPLELGPVMFLSTKHLSAFFPCPEILSEAKIKSNGLGSLVEETS